MMKRYRMTTKLQHSQPFANKPLRAKTDDCERQQRPAIPKLEIMLVGYFAWLKARAVINILQEIRGGFRSVEFPSGALRYGAENIASHPRLRQFDIEFANIEAAIVAADRAAIYERRSMICVIAFRKALRNPCAVPA